MTGTRVQSAGRRSSRKAGDRAAAFPFRVRVLARCPRAQPTSGAERLAQARLVGFPARGEEEGARDVAGRVSELL
jgi:hypothetical protein